MFEEKDDSSPPNLVRFLVDLKLNSSTHIYNIETRNRIPRSFDVLKGIVIPDHLVSDISKIKINLISWDIFPDKTIFPISKWIVRKSKVFTFTHDDLNNPVRSEDITWLEIPNIRMYLLHFSDLYIDITIDVTVNDIPFGEIFKVQVVGSLLHENDRDFKMSTRNLLSVAYNQPEDIRTKERKIVERKIVERKIVKKKNYMISNGDGDARLHLEDELLDIKYLNILQRAVRRYLFNKRFVLKKYFITDCLAGLIVKY